MNLLDIFKTKRKAAPPDGGAPQLENAEERRENPVSFRVPAGNAVRDAQMAEMIYANNPPWLREDGRVADGAGIGALCAAEVARLVTVEASVRAPYNGAVDDAFQTHIAPNLRVVTEKGWALGGVIFKPYYVNAELTIGEDGRVEGVSGDIKIGFFYPSEYLITGVGAGGDITRVIFFKTVKKDADYYTLAETQSFDAVSRALTITNEVFKTPFAPTRYLWNDLGTQTAPLETVKEWANIIPKMVFENVTGCLLGYFKPACADNQNAGNERGVSPLLRAAHAIKRVDLTYAAIDWELEAGLTRLYVDGTAIADFDDVPRKLSKYMVRLLGNENRQFFEKYSPEIRDKSYLSVLNAHLRQVEDVLGFAHGTFSSVENTARTAAEVVMSKQRTYVMVADNQRALRFALTRLACAVGVWLDPVHANEAPELVFDFDDSVINNPSEQLPFLLDLQSAGNISPVYVNMKYFGVPEDVAEKMVEDARKAEFARMSDPAERVFE